MTNLSTSPRLPPPPERDHSTSVPDLPTAELTIRNNHAHPVYGTDVELLQELARLRRTSDPETKRLIDIALQGEITDIDNALQEWTSKVLPPRQPKTRPQNPKNGKRGPSTKSKPPTRKQERAAEYKKCQDLFLHERTQLAHNILDGKPSTTVEEITPSIQDIEKFFSSIFEDHSTPDPEPVTAEYISVHLPVTEDDIKASISSWKQSAPGPDGITVGQVKGCPHHLLCILYNIVLYGRFTPSFWKQSRTILIEKDCDRTDPANWRPITIGSAVQRLLHRILARRLMTATKLHPLQRGFRDIDGTFANTMLLDPYVKARRASGKSYNVVSLRKAFDTVSHLQRKGVDPGLSEYILSTLDAHTRIRVDTRPPAL